jgi:hypothetical protein
MQNETINNKIISKKIKFGLTRSDIFISSLEFAKRFIYIHIDIYIYFLYLQIFCKEEEFF